MPEQPRPSTLFALALVTACTLAQQVVITRLFSAVLAYHFSFLAISIALFGTGAAALIVYLKPGWFGEDTHAELAKWTAIFGAALVVAPLVLVRLELTGFDTPTTAFALNLAGACIVAAVPPFASGVVVALAIARFKEKIGPVYAADLAGAGVGALGVVPTLWLGPAPMLLVGLGVLSAIAAVAFCPGSARAKRAGAGVGLGGLAVVAAGVFTPVLYLDPGYTLPEGTIKHGERWTPLARVFGFQPPHELSPALLFYDRVYAPVPVIRDGKLPDWRQLRTGPASIGFEVAGPGRTLIIGGGGGRDIYNALSSEQSPVDVIELIDGNRQAVDEFLGELSGKPYSREGVHTVIGDGRSILARRDTKYDQIHIGFTDTLTANAAQGFALTENNLYTVEAFEEYFDHLTPKGILNVSRLLKLVGDEALRVTVLTLAALEARGVEDPFQHIIVVLGSDILGPPTGTVLARLTPFTDEEVARVRALAGERADGLLLAPGGPNQREWAALAEAPSLLAFCNGHELDVCPPTDNKPFFFSMHRLSDWSATFSEGYLYSTSPYSILMLTLLILLGMSVVGFVLPLALVRKGKAPTATSLTYFAAIGLGFLLFEIVLIQRFVLFLGYPTYALSVVLFALLLSSGGGAWLSGRLRDTKRALGAPLAIAAGLIALSAGGLEPLLSRLIELPFGARVVIAVLLLTPVGACLGMAMPLGLRRFQRLHPDGVAYAWGVNGITSVLASVLGMAVAINFGFAVASLAAAGCYAFALGHAAFGRWPTEATA